MADAGGRRDEVATEEAAYAGRDPRRTGLAFAVVFAGGFLGSILREAATPVLPGALPGFPPWLPTLLINVAACFLIGVIYGQRTRVHHTLVHFAAIGFCGGLSTFSHFVQDVDAAWRNGGPAAALIPVLGSVALGIAAATLGEALARQGTRGRG